jgi:2-phospho-L-lactate guanylyltransferase
VTLAVVVPVRAFDLGKSRLAESFTPIERQILARAMADIVVDPSNDPGHDTDWFVVCDDQRVSAWAESRRATPVVVTASGLNAALTEARDSILLRSAASHVVISHADLPHAGDLVSTLRDAIETSNTTSGAPAIVIAPDRHRDGTNVIAIPRHRFAEWEFRYGSDSFTAHREVAARLGLGVVVLDDPRLATDVDTVDDLDLVRDFITATLPHRNDP